MSYNKKEALDAFSKLLDIMDELREKCPWDSKQTNETLRYLTIEETYELSDAILKNDNIEIKKELGDLLLHIIFYSKIADENGYFNIVDVINSICSKLINRHPHIYSNIKADDEETVKSNWEKIKINEGNKSVLAGVSSSLPSIIKSCRIQEKARGIGFDWENINQVKQKVIEEIEELKTEIENLEKKNSDNSKDKIENEFGDLLFALINYARFLKIDPDTALEKTNNKFINRFKYMEQQIINDGKNISEMSLKELDEYWEISKKYYK